MNKLLTTITWGIPLLMIWFGLFEINGLKLLVTGGLILTINTMIVIYNLVKKQDGSRN